MVLLTGTQAGNGPPGLVPEEREYIQTQYTLHYRALRAYAQRLGFRGEAAEDLLQETFLVAIRRIDALRQCESPRAWLIQVLRNLVGYQLRSIKYALAAEERLREAAEDSPEGIRDELPPETLYRGLVSEEELRLLLRCYLEGLSQKELARELGIEPGALKMRLQRAKTHLRQAMEKEGLGRD